MITIAETNFHFTLFAIFLLGYLISMASVLLFYYFHRLKGNKGIYMDSKHIGGYK